MATRIPDNAARFRLAEVAELTGGALVGADREVAGVITDSRRAAAETLFVALRGETHDAHRFLPQVAEAGGAALVEKGVACPEGLARVEVEDTLVALGALGHAWRERFAGRVVAITGSAGKTSTKELAAAGLSGAGVSALATEGNLNNRVGVPMTLLTLGDAHEVAVIEAGTSEPGEIATLGAMIAPEIAVVTLVAAAHTQGIGTVEDVFVEKTDLLRARIEGGVGIVNGDDERLRRCEGVRRYGFAEDADVRVLGWRMDGPRTVARYRLGERELEASLQLVGEAAALNGAGALAVAQALGVDLEAFCRGMGELAPVAGRMTPRPAGEALVLDDSYNANPSSVLLALRTAARVAEARGGRLLAVLGDMKELGALSEAKHREVRAEADARAARAFFVGPEMAAVGDALEDLELDALLAAIGPLAAGDVVLVKGSRSMALERVVEALVAREEAAA